MPNNGRDRRRRNGGRVTSQPRRPVQARGGGRDQRYRSARNYRTIRGTDTGYNLRRSSINFGGRRGGLVGTLIANPRLLVVGIAAVAVCILLIVGIGGCVRGCAARRAEQAEQAQRDTRVAEGTSDVLADRLTAALDQGDRLAAIAEHANEYDPRLVELALAEPTAIDFVADYLDSEHEGNPYDGKVTKGYYTPLYCWNASWGAVDFAGGALAVTGSGPTAVSMACMGLTGSTENTPDAIAARIEEAGETSDMLGLASSFLTDHANELALSAEEHEPGSETLTTLLDAGTVVLVQLKADTPFGQNAHWVLAATENADGTVLVYDPTSTSASTRPWAAATVATAADNFIALSAASTSSQDDTTD